MAISPADAVKNHRRILEERVAAEMKIAADIEFIIDNTVSKVESASGDRGFKFNIDTEQLSDTVITALRNRYKCAGWKYMALRPRHDTISHDVVGYTITLGM